MRLGCFIIILQTVEFVWLNLFCWNACEKSASKQFALAVLTYRDKTQSQHGLFHHHSIVENSWQSESHRTRSDCQCWLGSSFPCRVFNRSNEYEMIPSTKLQSMDDNPCLIFLVLTLYITIVYGFWISKYKLKHFNYVKQFLLLNHPSSQIPSTRRFFLSMARSKAKTPEFGTSVLPPDCHGSQPFFGSAIYIETY